MDDYLLLFGDYPLINDYMMMSYLFFHYEFDYLVSTLIYSSHPHRLFCRSWLMSSPLSMSILLLVLSWKASRSSYVEFLVMYIIVHCIKILWEFVYFIVL